MPKPAYNRAVIALMLLAAMATYADAPRLASTILLGNAANFVAVLDSHSRARMTAQLAGLPQDSNQAVQLSHTLDDGTRSLAVVESMPVLPGLIAPGQVRSRIEAASPLPRLDSVAASDSDCTLGCGQVATLALPPPPGLAFHDQCTRRNVHLPAGLPARGPPSAA